MRIRWKGFELPSRIIHEESTKADTFGRFFVEPFEQGYGHTIGNSIRRVLLSSLDGFAPYAIKIEGVSHEFSALDGVYEDVPEIILNIKQLLTKVDSDEEAVVRIEKTGKGPVTAADIQCDHTVTVLNTDLVIATLTEDVTFKMEIRLKSGRGYVKSEEHESMTAQPEHELIYVDSIFSPVTKVAYKVEKTRVGRNTNYDRLTLDVNTDGSISPEDALVECAIILRKHLNPFIKYFEISEMAEVGAIDINVDSEQEDSDIDPELQQKLQQSIRVLDPSVRVSNCLEEANIKTLGDLISRSETELSRIRNFGKTSLDELKEKLESLGLAFGMSLTGGAPAPSAPVETSFDDEPQMSEEPVQEEPVQQEEPVSVAPEAPAAGDTESAAPAMGSEEK